MNRRTFVNTVVATAAVASVAALSATQSIAAPSTEYRDLLEALNALAIDYCGPQGLGELVWFTETGPNAIPFSPTPIVSSAFTTDLIAEVTAIYNGSALQSDLEDELVGLYESGTYAASQGVAYFGSGTVASSFALIFDRALSSAQLTAALGNIFKNAPSAHTRRAVEMTAHMLGSLGLTIHEIKSMMDEALGDLCDVRITGSITPASNLTVTNTAVAGVYQIASSTSGGSTGSQGQQQGARKKFTLGKLLRITAGLLVGSLLGTLVGGLLGNPIAGAGMGGGMGLAWALGHSLPVMDTSSHPCGVRFPLGLC